MVKDEEVSWPLLKVFIVTPGEQCHNLLYKLLYYKLPLISSVLISMLPNDASRSTFKDIAHE